MPEYQDAPPEVAEAIETATPVETTTNHAPEKYVVRLKFFGLVTLKPEEFVEKLENLCQEYVDSPEEYCFSWDTDFTAE
ncbi:hypothetical protein F4Y93_05000 [Candidatus Poribacteria bacterium]|nr:hypothetical protein [Candidatus Poribacteria bacterium]